MPDVAGVAAPMRADGATLQTIADHLTREGYVTRQGRAWGPVQVKRVLDRIIRIA